MGAPAPVAGGDDTEAGRRPAALIAVYTTVADAVQAEALATGAIEAGLAACVQQHDIVSTYRWQGRVQREPEVRLMFKTTRPGYARLARWLAERHPYELPAIHALPVVEAAPDYADWVRAAVVPSPAAGDSSDGR
jgi:periplasmic divalent cation tolerance protein